MGNLFQCGLGWHRRLMWVHNCFHECRARRSQRLA
jgi:hypothetical protein